MSIVPSIRAAAVLLVCGALALPLAACGSSGGGGDGTAAAADDARDTARLELQQCLRENGVEGVGEPGGEGGPPGEADTEAMREALEGPCADLARGAFGSISEEDRAEFEDARVRMTACLKEQGVDLPEPEAGRPALLRIDPDDEELQAAMEACRDELPADLRDGPGPGGFRGGQP